MDEQKLREIQSRSLTAETRAKLHSEMQYRDTDIELRIINPEERTADFSFAAGALVPRWYGIEKLDMNPKAIRMDRWVDNPPLLLNHWIDDQVGAIRKGRLEDGKLRGTPQFSRSQKGEDTFNDVNDGIRTKTSVGYAVHADRELKPEEMTEEEKRMAIEYGLPVILVYDWEPLEGSIVWQGADPGVGLGRSVKAFIERSSQTAIDREIERKVEEAINKRLPADAAQDQHNKHPQGGKTVEPITKEQLDAAVKAERERAAAEVEERYKREEEENKKRVAELTAAGDAFKDEVPDALVRAAKAAADRNVTVIQFYAELREARAAEAAKRKKADPTSPGANLPGDEEIVSLRDFVEPWERRAAKVLCGLAYRAKGNQERAEQLLKEAREMEANMTPRQKAAEEKRAIDVVKNSGLSRLQQKRLMSGLSDGAGAYLVPVPMLAEIFAIVEQQGVARRYFRPIAMTRDKLDLNSISTKPTAYWVTEGSNITSTDLGFGRGQMNAEKLAAIAAWTNEQDEDALVSMLPLIVDWMAEAIYVKEDIASFLGDGTGTYGSQTGMLIASTNIVTLATGKTLIAHVDADDYRSLRDAVPVNMRRGAGYFLPPALVSGLEGKKNSQGDYIYRPPGAGMPATLWGYPIFDNEGIDALTQADAASTKVAAFGNPKHMLFGMRRALDIYVSREGVLQAGDGSISVNALQADANIVRLTERIAIENVLSTAIAVLRTAAS